MTRRYSLSWLLAQWFLGQHPNVVQVSGFMFSKPQEEDIEELPDSVDVYKGYEVVESDVHYGPDVSYTIWSLQISDNYPWLPHNVDPEHNPTPPQYKDKPLQILGNRQEKWESLIEGCRKFYGRQGRMCDSTERDRVEMNRRQPKSMQNYTELGFKKIKAPDDVFAIIKKFWDDNMDKKSPEKWNSGNTYTNHWDSPTHMVNIEDTKLRGGGMSIKNRIWSLAKRTLQEWTGEELAPCSLYGIRVYSEGSVLATHVDRMPLVSSAIINVAQDVDEPWPIEVYAHNGKAYNVTMEPGDMVLYESHSVLHGRPFPLKGRFYANIFIHFEPVGHSLRHNYNAELGDVEEHYRDSVKNQRGGHENHQEGLPVYILDDSEEANRWHGKWKPSQQVTVTTGSTDAHAAATNGDVKSLEQIAQSQKEQLTTKDVNGWEPIHEAARGGHLEVLELLIKHGADVNERTNQGRGGSALFLATQAHGKHHRSVKYLTKMGAKYIEPDL